MTSRTTQLVSLGLVLLLVASAGGAAAQQSYLDRLFGLDDDEDPNSIATTLASVQGTVDGMQMGELGSTPNPEAQMDALARWYNNHSAAFVAYANAQVNATGAHNVINVTYVVDGNSETKYLILPVENGRYQSAVVQESLSPPGAESYVKIDEETYLVHYADGHTETREQVRYSVDDRIVVHGDAVGAILGDIQTLHKRYIKPAKDVTHAFATRLGAKYSGELESTLIRGEPDAS